MQLRDRKHLLDQLDATVLVISFEPPSTLQRFGWFRDLPFTVVSDPSRRLYGAFGLQTRSLLRLFDPQTIMAYTRAFVHGNLPRLRHTDLRQLGGDAVLNRAGDVVFVHRSETPSDRPPVEVLLRMLRETGQ
jgi:hypothetical protein